MSQKTWGGRFTGGTDARVEAFTESITFDRRRAGLWTVVQTIAWSMGSEYHARHSETAGWVLGVVGG